ncbi:hypothetical protein CEP53_010161 [Fusarium sp. AF-6]|nr:hypothetical protein CEP53_010161 [Fusarium sp. AF-6]
MPFQYPASFIQARTTTIFLHIPLVFHLTEKALSLRRQLIPLYRPSVPPPCPSSGTSVRYVLLVVSAVTAAASLQRSYHPNQCLT